MSSVYCGDALYIGGDHDAFVVRRARHAIYAQDAYSTNRRVGLIRGRRLCYSFDLCITVQKMADDRRAAVCKILKETSMEMNEGGAICVHDELVARSLRNNPIPQCIIDKLDLRARNVLLAARKFHFDNHLERD